MAAKPLSQMARIELIAEVVRLRAELDRVRKDAADDWAGIGEVFSEAAATSHEQARERAAALYRAASVIEPWPNEETYGGSIAANLPGPPARWRMDKAGNITDRLPKRVPGKALDEAQQANPAPEQVGTADDDSPDE